MVDLGKLNSLKPVRDSANGRYLDGGELGEILLPKKFVTEELRQAESISVFVYKDSEIDEFKKSGKIDELKKEFFEMVKPVDKENYFTIDNIAVGVDSKQNFDENYESNWYYYYK